MLQQTQVATVIPYYERFLARFPTVADLAAANQSEVLRMWAGLGYYARARNLHRAARAVVDQYGGRFPDTVDGLLALPGIGRYTAGAIASIAFDRRAAVVDGNVARVFSRLFDIDEDVSTGPGRARVWSLAESLLPRRRCGDFNQALMELGATVCLPGELARCLVCPLASHCAAREAGTVADRPVKARKTAPRKETHVVAAIEHRGRWLFIRRPEHGLWGGMWSLPSAVLNSSTSATLARRIADEMGFPLARFSKSTTETTHQLTHRSIRFVTHMAQVSHLGRGNSTEPVHWGSLERIESLGTSTAMRKVIDSIRSKLASRARRTT